MATPQISSHRSNREEMTNEDRLPSECTEHWLRDHYGSPQETFCREDKEEQHTKSEIGLYSASTRSNEARAPMISNISQCRAVNAPTIFRESSTCADDTSPLPPLKSAIPSILGVERGCPASMSRSKNHRVIAAAPHVPAIIPSWDRLIPFDAWTFDKVEVVSVNGAVIVPSF